MKTLAPETGRQLKTLADKLASLSIRTAPIGLTAVELGRKLRNVLRDDAVEKRACMYRQPVTGSTPGLWTVTLSLGGYFCVIGSLRSVGNGEQTAELALRFADMARVFFWKYRLRGASAMPETAQFNFSFAQAMKDLEFEKDLVALLKDEESLLLEAGVIRVLELDAKRERRARPVDQLNSRVSSVQVKLHEIECRLKTIEANVEGMREFQSQLVGLLQGVLYRLNDMQHPGCVQSSNPNAEPVKVENQVATPEAPVLTCAGK